jgi:ribonuclease HI
MELTGTIESLRSLSTTGIPVEVYTDSTYVIRGITQWIWAWRKRGWISSEGKEVANSDLWQRLFQVSSQFKVTWHYVRGHSGIPGNERADQIAVAFSRGERSQLYRGPLLQYDVAIHDIPENTNLPEAKPLTRNQPARPFSYLSLVGNIPMRHSTWKECEKRVRGQSNAKFKKAMKEEDEKVILQAWGLRSEDLKNQ